MTTQAPSINSLVAHWQWASRPDDERFTSLTDLLAFTDMRRRNSASSVLDTRQLRLAAGTNDAGDTDPSKLVFLSKEGAETQFTNYSFGQLCERVGSRPSEWRDVAGKPMPTPLMVPPLQWRLEYARQQMESPQAKLYYLPPDITSENGEVVQNAEGVLMAFTGPKYGRIYDADVCRKVVEFNERQGNTWHIPYATYQEADPKRATTLYASDHDSWIMLVRTDRPIDDGTGRGALYQLLIVSNSEVGDARFNLTVGLYSTICDNRIIWGLTGAQTVSLVHNAQAPERFTREAMPALLAYGAMSTTRLEDAMANARKQHIEAPQGAPDVMRWLAERGFSQTASKTALDLVANGDAGAPSDDPTNLWNVVNGLTAYARGITHTDDRVAFERQVGALLEPAR
jgi:hypothetical protein